MKKVNKTSLVKKLFIFIAAIILVFQGFGSFLDVDSVKAQGDVTAPTLKSVEVRTGGQVRFYSRFCTSF